MLTSATRPARFRVIAAICVLAAGLAVSAGCAATAPDAPARSAASSAAVDGGPSPSPPSSPSHPSPSPSAAVLVPGGSAQQNLAVFRAVTERVWHGPSRAHGRAYVDALVAAGFDKKAMQVTEDRSTVGNAAESLQFSVHWKDGECLVGQVGPDTGSPVTVVLPGLADGACLLGATRPIDW